MGRGMSCQNCGILNLQEKLLENAFLTLPKEVVIDSWSKPNSPDRFWPSWLDYKWIIRYLYIPHTCSWLQWFWSKSGIMFEFSATDLIINLLIVFWNGWSRTVQNKGQVHHRKWHWGNGLDLFRGRILTWRSSCKGIFLNKFYDPLFENHLQVRCTFWEKGGNTIGISWQKFMCLYL